MADHFERLERALDAWLDYVDDGNTDAEAFLAATDPEVRPLLEPMLTVRPAATPTPGRIGQYRIVREVGRGGMGVVYEAEDEALERRIALKVLGPHFALSAASLERFRREAAAAARLRHPGIAQVHGIGQTGDAHWIAMELVDGINLSERLRSGAPLDLVPNGDRGENVAELVAQVAEALEFAHRQQVVHRDIKPHNILIGADGRARLVDFGLAKLLDRDSLSVTGDFAGSLSYSSPEQIGGSRDVDERTDIWSLGVVMYEALSRARPFEADTHEAVVHAILTRDPPPPEGARDPQTICLKALEKEPARRYPSAGAMAADLRRFLQREPIHAAPPSSVSRLLRFVRRRRTAVAALAATAALVGVSVTLIVMERRQANVVSELVDSAHSALLELERMLRDGSATTSHEMEHQRQRVERLVEDSERLLGLQPDDPTLQRTVARAHERAARVYQRLKLEQESLSAHGRALELLETLVRSDADDLEATSDLAASFHNRHVLHRALGRDTEGARDLNEAIGRWQAVIDRSGDSELGTTAMARLAVALTNRARSHIDTPQATADLDRATQLWQRVQGHRELTGLQRTQSLETEVSLAEHRSRSGHQDDARSRFDELVERIHGLDARIAERTDLLELHARILMSRGELARMQGDDDTAHLDLETAVELSTVVAEGSPDGVANLVLAQFAFAAFLIDREIELERAAELLGEAAEHCEALLEQNPGLIRMRHELARIAGLEAHRAMIAGQAPPAIEAALQRAVRLQRELVDSQPHAPWVAELAEIEGTYGGWLRRQARPGEAAAVLTRALASTEGALRESPGHPILQRNLRVQARDLMSSFDMLSDVDGLVATGERVRTALPGDPVAFRLAIRALDRAIHRSNDADEFTKRAIEWITAADAEGLEWRDERWARSLTELPRDRELTELLKSRGGEPR